MNSHRYSHRFEFLLSKEELDKLDKLAIFADRSRAYIVREALDLYFKRFLYEDDHRAK
jgi:predicted transcriptional regulator